MQINKMLTRSGILWGLFTVVAVLVLTACGGGSSSGDGGGTNTVTVSGTASAPGGTVAFLQPTGLQRFFASIVGAPAHAAIEGLAGVAGATVELVEVDATGADVSVIATATTSGSGAFSIDAPEGFTAGTQYIVRIQGSTDALESRVTSTSVDIDPVTDVTSELVTTATAASGLSAVTTTEVDEFFSAVDSVASELDPTGLDSAQLSTSLATETGNNEVASNIISSTTATGEICGTVTDSSSNPLANIRIVARDFGNWVTRAKTKTASDGTYCLNVPKAGDTDTFTGGTLTGEYILGAFNRTGDSNDSGRHASEWWSTGGTAYNQFDAEMISVPDTTTVSGKDFQLELGARITGSVTASDTDANLEGVKVIIRDFDNRTVLTSARVKADGTYRVNVIPGKYLVVARNKTVQPYASEVYDASTGTNNRNLGLPVTVSVGEARTVDFALESGSKLSGTITDGGSPVKGMRVMVNNSSPGGPADRLRTNKEGKYRIWLRPAIYKVYAYGQRNESVDLTASNQTVDFSGTVNAISATLQDSGGNPISQAKFRLYDSSNVFLGFEISNSDGTVTMHTDQTGDHRAQIRIDHAASAGSIIYNGQTQLGNATAINIAASDVALSTISLPDGGVLTGKVYAGSSTDADSTATPIGNFSVEVRDGGTANTNRFTRVTTRGDGSYVLTLPAGTYERVKMRDATTGGNCDGITITAGVTTTVNYYDGDDTCEVL